VGDQKEIPDLQPLVKNAKKTNLLTKTKQQQKKEEKRRGITLEERGCNAGVGSIQRKRVRLTVKFCAPKPGVYREELGGGSSSLEGEYTNLKKKGGGVLVTQ